MRAALVALGVATIAVGAGGIAVAAGTTPTATCTNHPAITQTTSNYKITVVCSMPKPPVATVTVTATPKPTVTADPTPSNPPAASKPAEPTTPAAPTSTPTSSPTTATGGFPDASNTGVPAGTTLKRVPQDITSGQGWAWQTNGGYVRANAGAVLSGLDIAGNVEVYGANVTIENTRITATGETWGVGVRGVSGAVVKDSTISGGGKRLLVGVKDVTGSSDITVLRCDIADWTSGIQMSRGVVQDNYVHDAKFATGDHLNGFTDNGGRTDGTLTIRHNTFLNSYGQTDAISLFEDFGTVSNVTVADNLMAGGGYSLYAGGGKAGNPSKNITVTGNEFSTRYYTGGGSYGPVIYWDTDPTNTWANNTWHDGPSAGKTITAP